MILRLIQNSVSRQNRWDNLVNELNLLALSMTTPAGKKLGISHIRYSWTCDARLSCKPNSVLLHLWSHLLHLIFWTLPNTSLNLLHRWILFKPHLLSLWLLFSSSVHHFSCYSSKGICCLGNQHDVCPGSALLKLVYAWRGLLKCSWFTLFLGYKAWQKWSAPPFYQMDKCSITNHTTFTVSSSSASFYFQYLNIKLKVLQPSYHTSDLLPYPTVDYNFITLYI